MPSGLVSTADRDAGLIDAIYDAAGDGGLWNTALISVAETFNSASSVFIGHNEDNWNAPCFAHFGRLDPGINMHGTSSACPYLPRLGAMRLGEITSTEDIMPLADRKKSGWHQEIMVAQGLAHCLMSVLTTGLGVFGAFFIARSEAAGDFTLAERAGFARIVPHLRRAAQLHCRLDAYGALARQNHEMLEYMKTGIVLIGEDGKALSLNSAADSAIADLRCLRLSSKRLSARDASANVKLERLIATTISGGPCGTLAIPPRGEDGMPCVVRVCPLRGKIRETVAHKTRPGVAVFINGPQLECETLDHGLVEFYQLTWCEARVANLLAAGLGISGAARRLDLSENTIKMHAKRTFEKLGVISQTQLAHLFGRLAAPTRSFEPKLAA